jgi:hypothetical protein
MKHLLIIVLALSGVAAAQCPLEMSQFFNDDFVQLDVQNVSGKQIAGGRLIVTHYNRLWEPAESDASYDFRAIKYTRKVSHKWQRKLGDAFYQDSVWPGATIRLDKIVFTDGSVWEAKDHPGECPATPDSYLRKHPRPGTQSGEGGK